MLYDDTHWPLCILILEGKQSLGQHMDILDVWNGWFARRERFISLRVHLDDDALDHAPGTGRASTEWLKAGAGKSIRELVAAMAIVTPPSSLHRFQHLSVQAVFGVPGTICSDVDNALRWVAGSVTLIPPRPADVKPTILRLIGQA
jgi:hypothetical protein